MINPLVLKLDFLGYISSLSELASILSSKTYILSNKFGQNNTLKVRVGIILRSVFYGIINIMMGFLGDIYLNYAFTFCFFALVLGVCVVYFYISKCAYIDNLTKEL